MVSEVSRHLWKMVEDREKLLINKLIKCGIYKSLDNQLYELPLSELEREYKDMLYLKKHIER